MGTGEYKGPSREEQIMLTVLAALEGLISVICDSGQTEGLSQLEHRIGAMFIKARNCQAMGIKYDNEKLH